MSVKSVAEHALDSIEEVIFVEHTDMHSRLTAIEEVTEALDGYLVRLRGRAYYEEQERRPLRVIAEVTGRHYATIRDAVERYRTHRGLPRSQRANRERAARMRALHVRRAQAARSQ